MDAFLPLLATVSNSVDVEVAEGANQFTQLVGQFGIAKDLVIAQVINFCVVAFLLYRFAFKPVLANIDNRQRKIADGLQYAEEMKRKLADAEKQHTETVKAATLEGQKIIQEARENAKTHLERQIQQAAHQAEDILHKANEAIELERKKMLAQVRDEIAQLVVETSAKVLSKELSDNEKNTFTQAATKQVCEERHAHAL